MTLWRQCPAEENQQGNLTRGLRAVLTHHLLFAFNRQGISAEHQHLLATAASPKQVVTKRAEDGTAVSSASSPNLVAEMLEALDVAPGHRVLEIGAATGINAALLAELVGPAGEVVTIELDDDLAAGARAGLAAAGYPQVEVICGDGALGHPARAPYDRIIVTAGAWDIASAWWQQLALGGRLVVPLRLHGSGLTRAIALNLPAPGQMISTLRERTDDTSELGVIAHGPDSTELAAQLSDLLQRWNQKQPTQPTITAHPIDTPDIPLPSAHHIVRPHTRLTITWPPNPSVR
ncbi:MAG: methyltransferase domain-containing protein [Pseudonocardiaceae bacterium]